MQTSVEVLSASERQIAIKVPAERIDQKIEERLQEVLPKVRLDGFRPGKVPMSVVRKRFGDSIRREIISEVIDETYRDAVTQEKLAVAGMLNMNVTKDEAGAPLEYQVRIEVYPEVKVREDALNAVELEHINVDIASKDVDARIQEMRRQKATWLVVDRASQKGDKVTISFEGRLNGELFDGGAGKNMPLELGSGSTIAGFEDAFMGHNVGDSVNTTLTFPTEYFNKALAGKPVEFTGTIHKIEAPELPALDETFAKEVGVEEGGIEQLRQKILERMQKEVVHQSREYLKEQLFDHLRQLYPLTIPKTIMSGELKKLQEQEQAHMSRLTGKQEPLFEPREELKELAERRIHLGLLFAELLKHHNIVADAERVDAMIMEIANGYGDPEMVTKVYRQNADLLRQIEERVVEDQLTDNLLTQVKQREKAMSYAEFKEYDPAKNKEN